MPNPMLNSRPRRGVGLGRSHNYQAMYDTRLGGQETSGNARVWSVYLDEADARDAYMIDNSRTILDSLLVFASLFSAVVTTFVAQTSQVLQLNNARITVFLLVENNELLRAAGNTTKIDAVPPSSLGPNTTTYTSTDVWVNGLFFTSLTLSVTTALLSVLAKQWIQAYSRVVSGDAKTQAMIRQFRFDGLNDGNLRVVIEGLPLLLHGSVAIFLVGLALYVSQISIPICVIISFITFVTLIIYVGTSMIPVFLVHSPYRLPAIYAIAQFSLAVSDELYNRIVRGSWKPFPLQSLAEEEFLKAITDHEIWKCLSWLFAHSTNSSTKEIAVEGVSGTLRQYHQYRIDGVPRQFPDLHTPLAVELFLDVLVYSVNRRRDLNETYSTWDTAISAISSIQPFPFTGLRKEIILRRFQSREWHDFELGIWSLYVASRQENNPLSSGFFLGLMTQFKMEGTIGQYLVAEGNEHDIRCALDEDTRHLFLTVDDYGETMLHRAAKWGNLDAIIPLLEYNPQLINAQTRHGDALTPLDYALRWYVPPFQPEVVQYLLDHGASRPILVDARSVYSEQVIEILETHATAPENAQP